MFRRYQLFTTCKFKQDTESFRDVFLLINARPCFRNLHCWYTWIRNKGLDMHTQQNEQIIFFYFNRYINVHIVHFLKTLLPLLVISFVGCFN